MTALESNALTVISPRSLDEAKEMATALAGSRLLPLEINKAPDILAAIMAGAELGLAPMQSLRAIVIIKGKPTLAADAMGALVKSKADICEYLVLKESSAKVARYETKRRGDPTPTTMAFSIEEAAQAGLTGGESWRKYTAAMLRARALSAICRAVYPDLLLGVYDPDELGGETPTLERVTPTTPQNEADMVKALKASIETFPAGEPKPTPAKKRKLNIIDVEAKPAVEAAVEFSEAGERLYKQLESAEAEKDVDVVVANAKGANLSTREREALNAMRKLRLLEISAQRSTEAAFAAQAAEVAS